LSGDGRDAEVRYGNDKVGLWRSHHDGLLDAVLSGLHRDLVEPARPRPPIRC